MNVPFTIARRGPERGERGDVGVRSPPVQAVHERHARAHEQDATGGRGSQRGPQRRQPQSTLRREGRTATRWPSPTPPAFRRRTARARRRPARAPTPSAGATIARRPPTRSSRRPAPSPAASTSASQKLSITRSAGSQRTPNGSRASASTATTTAIAHGHQASTRLAALRATTMATSARITSTMTSGCERTTSPSADGVSVPHASARVSARRASSGTVQKLVTSAATTSQRSA